MKKILFSFGFLFLVSVLSFAQNTNNAEEAKPNPNAPEITFQEISHDFGNLQKGADCSYEFKFKNTGKEPLILSNCQASCGCTTPLCPKEPIAPGGSGVIKVKYDSNRVGVFSKTITVTSNAKTPSIILSIKGTIEATPQDEGFPGKNNNAMGH